MKKPEGYDAARVSGDFTPVELGGHFAVIKQVSEKETSTGKPMIVVVFDFCAPDPQAGYFAEAFNKDDRDGKKWPFNGTKYIMVEDYRDPKKTSSAFKSFCNYVEKSNGYEVKWGGSDWGKQFKDKKIGVVFGQEEQEWDGRTFMRHVPKFFCKFDKANEASIPRPKYLVKDAPASTPSAPKDDMGFMAIPDGTEDEIPF